MRTWTCIDGSWRPGELDGGPRWYDLSGADRDDLLELASRYHLHPLAIEDCLSPYLHTPKIDDFGSYLFIVVLAMKPGTVEPILEELDIFLGPDFLITYRDDPATAPEVDGVVHALEQGLAVRPGTDGLFYEVLDRVVDSFLPRVSSMSEQLDALADLIIEGDRNGGLSQRVLEMRRTAGSIRRTMAPLLSVVLRFGRGEFALVQPSNVIYFRDIYDHLLRVDLALEELRDDAEVALNTYLSTLNNKMNEVMKVLAVVAALALPATVITGIFGTNFEEIPGLRSNYGFGAMLLAIAGIAASMALFFRRRGWF
ncbi:magnesium transporter CorA family protein [Tepidiforma thermophila]|uniref:magnesium transporter CorA family protein n=1 Tax=Tepidiforma thermophila (strain KCTC 52669 / CGMCC 1.13589 / G233) TaxID=2761530 RepID=UPI0013FD77B6|nr:magnesium transporter CorA family protein [Tepidiforma thermophila]